jgi:SAM-dependent methyltransferase
VNDVLDFVRGALPEPPARVLEIGAGRGELATDLAGLGYDVVAIDSAGGGPNVVQVALQDVDEPPESFDAAVAVRSLHHVEPLPGSFARLADLLRPGGRLVIDELDVERFDERAAAWLMAQRAAGEGEHSAAQGQHAGGASHLATDPASLVEELRHHLHPLGRIREELARAFVLGDVAHGAYLYRWELPSGLRGEEERLIAGGLIPAVGARFVATRAPRPSGSRRWHAGF